MVYTSDEIKEASFVVLEDEVIKKLVFKRNDGSLLELSVDSVPSDPELIMTYNGDGTVNTVTENGVVTSYTYNVDGTVATSTRLSVTREYTYDGDNLVSVI